jgi:hypothetical protein
MSNIEGYCDIALAGVAMPLGSIDVSKTAWWEGSENNL